MQNVTPFTVAPYIYITYSLNADRWTDVYPPHYIKDLLAPNEQATLHTIFSVPWSGDRTPPLRIVSVKAIGLITQE